MGDRSPGGRLGAKPSREVVRMLRHFGFVRKRHGTHGEIYEGERGGQRRVACVPPGREAILPRTLHSILEQAGLTKEEAIEFFQH